jgi:hypothetical protein
LLPPPGGLDIDHTAVDIEGDGFELTLSQQLFEEFEIDFPQHLGRFVAKVSQEPGYCFRFFDGNGKLFDQGIALQQFQTFEFVNSDEVTAEVRKSQNSSKVGGK